MKHLIVLTLTFYSLNINAQKEVALPENRDFEADRLAKEAAGNVMRFSGLSQDIELIQKDVPNVVAYMRQGKRYVAYNPSFLLRLRNKAESDWAVYSVVSHEIGHHLAGHTETSGRTNPGNELAADYFSGFVLRRMGANLDEALLALLSLRALGEIRDTVYHPPFAARLLAVKEGWLSAGEFQNIDVLKLQQSDSVPEFVYECRFAGDANVYYIDRQNRVIWFNPYGKAIVLGAKIPDPKGVYLWLYTYADNKYGVDSYGVMWAQTDFGSQFKVGNVVEIIYK
ncbi:MAG: M48 family metalloprotease [Flavobacteriales bacterium]|jgi:hypothetical protein|nr:M48 family metalloprotease [Flavobacteriales bacterium]